MCPLNVFTFDIMKVAICQLSYFTDRLEVMEWCSVRESVMHFLNDIKQDTETTT